jgi:hypothetical protein
MWKWSRGNEYNNYKTKKGNDFMRIFDHRPENENMKPIGNLNPGTVFEYEFNYYMKGTDTEGMPNHNRTIDLDSGEIIYLETFVQVLPLPKAHLEIPKDEVVF